MVTFESYWEPFSCSGAAYTKVPTPVVCEESANKNKEQQM